MADITVPGDGDFDTNHKPVVTNDVKARSFHRTFLLTVLIFTGLLFLWVINYFLVAIIVAGSLATLFNPLNLWLRRILRKNKGLAAFFTCIVLLLGILVPAVIIGDIVVSQAISSYEKAQETIQQWTEQGDEAWFGRLRNSRLVRWIHLQDIEWSKVFEQALQGVGTGAASLLNIVSKNVFGFFCKISDYLVHYVLLFFVMASKL